MKGSKGMMMEDDDMPMKKSPMKKGMGKMGKDMPKVMKGRMNHAYASKPELCGMAKMMGMGGGKMKKGK